VKTFGLILMAVLTVSGRLEAEEPSRLDIHEWSVWVTEPAQGIVNPIGGYPSAMPGLVETARSRRAQAERPNVSPLSLITFWGKPEDAVDLSLRMTSGRFIAHWPPADIKNNRLAWNDLKLTRDSAAEKYGFVADDHWFTQARKLDALEVHRGSRAERFLAYDPELNLSLPVRLEGGAGKYQVFNGSKYPLKDLLVVAPAEGGRCVGWLDELPPGVAAQSESKAKKEDANAANKDAAAKAAPMEQSSADATGAKDAAQGTDGSKSPSAPASAEQPQKPHSEAAAAIAMSAPLSDEQLRVQGPEALKKRLAAAGLTNGEIDLMLSLCEKAFFQASETTLLFRLPQGTVDELLPLDVEPDTAKTTRVALVLCFKVDPAIRDQVQKLIERLGDNSYVKREEAEGKLRDLGRMAIPALKEAVKGSDPERVIRAERLLLRQKESLDSK
jgi:hypothetical protein